LSRFSQRLEGIETGGPLWRKIVATLVFASFFWLSLAAQTHIHGLQPAGFLGSSFAKIATGSDAAQAPARDTSPDGLANCPLCQAVGHGSAFIAPNVVSLLVVPIELALQSWPLAPVQRAGFTDYDHQTRGPPLL
jgi:hypothetical protein